MNERVPDEDAPDEIDDWYRRSAARDPSRPSEAIRRSILEHAARAAVDHASAARGASRARASWRGWRPALFGTLAAAMLAGLVVIPRLWTPDTLLPAARPSATAELAAGSDSPAKKSLAPAPAPRMEEVAPVSRAKRDPVEASRGAAAPGAKLAAAAPQPPAFAAADSEPLTNVTATAAPAAPAAVQRRSDSLDARQRTDGSAVLRNAAREGDLDTLNRSFDSSVDVNGRDDRGRTALMLAILNRRGEAVDALLAHGADPNLADAAGTTPLAAAQRGGDPSIVSSLQRSGAR